MRLSFKCISRIHKSHKITSSDIGLIRKSIFLFAKNEILCEIKMYLFIYIFPEIIQNTVTGIIEELFLSLIFAYSSYLLKTPFMKL
jgi:hypothetical protein